MHTPIMIGILSPEDKRFILECLENDEVVLEVRRLKDQSKAVQYVSTTLDCGVGIAIKVVRAILN